MIDDFEDETELDEGLLDDEDEDGELPLDGLDEDDDELKSPVEDPEIPAGFHEDESF